MSGRLRDQILEALEIGGLVLLTAPAMAGVLVYLRYKERAREAAKTNSLQQAFVSQCLNAYLRHYLTPEDEKTVDVYERHCWGLDPRNRATLDKGM